MLVCFIHCHCTLVPFDEDENDPSVWFLDHNYAEQMYDMFHKVDGIFIVTLIICLVRENIIGWYSTGSKTKAADLSIHELFFKYTPNPVYAIIDVQSTDSIELPVITFVAKEELVEETLNNVTTSTIVKQFHQIASEVGTLEAEDSILLFNFV